MSVLPSLDMSTNQARIRDFCLTLENTAASAVKAIAAQKILTSQPKAVLDNRIALGYRLA